MKLSQDQAVIQLFCFNHLPLLPPNVEARMQALIVGPNA